MDSRGDEPPSRSLRWVPGWPVPFGQRRRSTAPRLYRLWRALKQPSPIIEGGPTSGLCAEKTLDCYSGAGGNDQFQATFGSGGVWNFFFQGCSLFSTESVALAGIPGPNFTNAYEPPPGYKCKMILHNGNSGAQIYDTGYVSNPINGFADTGGVLFITLAQFPDGQNKVCVVIQCDPV